MSKIYVLGSGILGLSVASVLRWKGHEVTVFGARHITDSNATEDPLFASAYPAASVIPHTVNAVGLNELVADSTSVFSTLGDLSEITGVRLQRHFEVSESGLNPPSYADALQDFEICPRGESPIQRPGGDLASGYFFSCHFCDMPRYGPWLAGTVESLGVKVEKSEIDAAWLKQQKVDYFVNCLGAGAHAVFEDIAPGIFVRGILLLAKYQAVSKDVVSYNYTPASHAYPASDGNQASDVYFYPRTGHCVLGGTRQSGRLGVGTNEFVPDNELKADLVEMNGVYVPKPIFELNRELVNQLTGVELERPFKTLIGYRHLDQGRDGIGRVTIERRDRQGLAPTLDCFGFGGAGVTLSWGAAIRVLNTLESSQIGAGDDATAFATFLANSTNRL